MHTINRTKPAGKRGWWRRPSPAPPGRKEVILLTYMQLILVASLSLFADQSYAVAQTKKVQLDLTQLGLEELLDVEVTSASKKEEKLFETAAASILRSSQECSGMFRTCCWRTLSG